MMMDAGIVILPFPLKLHALLEETTEETLLGFDDIIAWMPDGRSFRIFDKDKLEQQGMPKFFNSCKYRTFQRSLNLWGFETAKTSSSIKPSARLHDQATAAVEVEYGCRYHPFFIRGRQELVKKRGASKGETAVSTPPTWRTISTSNKM